MCDGKLFLPWTFIFFCRTAGYSCFSAGVQRTECSSQKVSKVVYFFAFRAESSIDCVKCAFTSFFFFASLENGHTRRSIFSVRGISNCPRGIWQESKFSCYQLILLLNKLCNWSLGRSAVRKWHVRHNCSLYFSTDSCLVLGMSVHSMRVRLYVSLSYPFGKLLYMQTLQWIF